MLDKQVIDFAGSDPLPDPNKPFEGRLEQLFTKYGTDKGIWGYTPAYEAAFNGLREKVRCVLEIGICGDRDIPNNRTGASLFAWQDYFPNADIYGVDNERKWMVEEGRIRSFCMDAYAHDNMRKLGETIGAFDFICDDAVHDPDPQVLLFYSLFPYLAADGVYAIEDVCPYKLPDGDLGHMLKRFPPSVSVQVINTHKAEKLLLIKRVK